MLTYFYIWFRITASKVGREAVRREKKRTKNNMLAGKRFIHIKREKSHFMNGNFSRTRTRKKVFNQNPASSNRMYNKVCKRTGYSPMRKNAWKLFSVTNGERWGWDVTLSSATLYPDYNFLFSSFLVVLAARDETRKGLYMLMIYRAPGCKHVQLKCRCNIFNKGTTTQSGILLVLFMIWMLIWDFIDFLSY